LPEWLVEEGVAEERALLIDRGEALAARLHWPGALVPGQVEDAVLISRAAGSSRGTARFANGEEALVDKLPRDAAEGARMRLEIVREAVREPRRTKLAQARPTTAAARPAPSLAERLREDGHSPRVVRAFPAGLWEDAWSPAWEGMIPFSGGSLHFAPTAAMTLIDIDGALPPAELARAAIAPIARAIELFDLGGPIGIDFPTVPDKAGRKAIDAELASALSGWQHESTAMNGFGFVQLVARLRGPSLLHRLSHDRAGAAARMLLRRAERDDLAPGPRLSLVAHPAVLAAIAPEWIEFLSRRTGRQIDLRGDPSLAFDGGFAQAIAP